jgi:hypothetical protein
MLSALSETGKTFSKFEYLSKFEAMYVNTEGFRREQGLRGGKTMKIRKADNLKRLSL